MQKLTGVSLDRNDIKWTINSFKKYLTNILNFNDSPCVQTRQQFANTIKQEVDG